MGKKRIRVFLSGTRKDLRPFWAVAADAVGSVESFEPAAMDDGAASPIPPDQWSRREATTPDLYLGLLGRCYGHVPSGQARSLTEQEYDTSGQVGIDRLVFLTEASDPTEVGGESVASHDAIERFRTKARADVVYDNVSTPIEFRAGIIKALVEWERRTIRGATAGTEDFYQPWLEGSPDFGHQDELLARDSELGSLEQFCASSQRVLVLRASWGQGKSRLLLELARRIGRRVRFVKEDASLNREALDISAVDPCVIVLEDVQRLSAEARRQFLAFIRRCGPEVKLIISSRPSHADAVLEDARQLGFPAGELARVELRPLDDREHRLIVARILGGETEEAYIIAERTKGSILAGVVTARLFHRGALTLGQIESGDEFRHAVLRAYEAQLVEQERLTVDQRIREALRVVAVAGPVRTDSDVVIAALADFLGWRPHVVRSTLADLVEGDLLIRRGGLVRVPVDALAEATRRQACVSTSGQSLGYAEESLSRLWPAVGGSLLRNLAALAFDLKDEGISIDFLQEFWPRFVANYDAAPVSRRLDMLEELEETAPYAPAATLAFVRHALPSGLGPAEEEELLRGRLPVHLVHDGLAKLMEGLLLHAEHVGEACDLLWDMAAADTRDPKHHTKSAQRILLETGKLRPRIELARYQALLRWVQRRHRGADAIPSRRLAAYTKPLLDREMERSWSTGDAIHMGASGLSARALGNLRREALEFLEEIGREDDLGTVAAALDGIGHTLSTNAGAFGRSVSPEEIAQWYPEELESLSRIKRIRERHGSRVVDLCVLSEVEWVAEHSTHIALRDQARDLVGAIREHLAGSLELAVSHAYHLYRDFEESRTQQHDRDVAGIAATHATLDASTLAMRIRDVCRAMEAAGRTPDPIALVFHIARAHPELGEALLVEALAEPDGVLVPSLGGVLDGLSQPDPARAVAAAERILASENPKPRRALAHVYRWAQFVDRVGSTVSVRHLDRLLGDADARVREGALLAIGFRDNLPLAERVRMLLEYDLAACPESGEEWAQAVHAKDILASLTTGQLEVVARKFGESAKLGFWSCELLETLSTRVPDLIVDVLVGRVPRARQDGFDAALDRTQKDPLGPLPDAARERGMIGLGPYLGSSDFKVAHAAGDLFGKLATGDAESMRRVRLAWIRSSEEAQVRQAAESLASEESEFLLEEESIVVELLQAADRFGPELLRVVESDLHAVGLRGIRTGTAGEVFARDVALRDGAAEIAQRHPEGSVQRRFYAGVSRDAQEAIDFHRRHDDERSV